MEESGLTRRQFLKGAAAGAAALGEQTARNLIVVSPPNGDSSGWNRVFVLEDGQQNSRQLSPYRVTEPGGEFRVYWFIPGTPVKDEAAPGLANGESVLNIRGKRGVGHVSGLQYHVSNETSQRLTNKRPVSDRADIIGLGVSQIPNIDAFLPPQK